MLWWWGGNERTPKKTHEDVYCWFSIYEVVRNLSNSHQQHGAKERSITHMCDQPLSSFGQEWRKDAFSYADTLITDCVVKRASVIISGVVKVLAFTSRRSLGLLAQQSQEFFFPKAAFTYAVSASIEINSWCVFNPFGLGCVGR